MKHHTLLELAGDGCEYPVTVDYDYDPPCRGSFERGGLQLEPDDPGGITINGCTLDADGREITLTSEQEKSIESDIYDEMSDRAADVPDRDDWDDRR